MIRAIIFSLLFFCASYSQVKVAVLGNSISVANWEPLLPEDNWVYLLQESLGDDYEIHNFARGGMTIFKYGKYPLGGSVQLQQTVNLQPDIVIIAMGSNDSNPGFWDDHSGEFLGHYSAIVDRLLREIPNLQEIYFCYPPWHKIEEFRENIEEMIPMIDQLAEYWAGYGIKTKIVDWYWGIEWDENLDFCTNDDAHICAFGLFKMYEAIYDIMKPLNDIILQTPSNFVATHINWGILLEWTPESIPSLESFVIYRDEGSWPPPDPKFYDIVEWPNSSYIDSSVYNMGNYYYQVSAIANNVQSARTDTAHIHITYLGIKDEPKEVPWYEDERNQGSGCQIFGVTSPE